MGGHTFFQDHGYQVWTKFFSEEQCGKLVKRAFEIVEAQRDDTVHAVFTTDESRRCDDAFFLNSATSIQCFYEPQVPDKQTQMVCNKIGHALHTQDDVFRAFAKHPSWAQIIDRVDVEDPIIIQSMVIFKAQQIGGAVDWHQDGCFLASEPKPVIGFWIALEDATLENGCLWVVPGGHRQGLEKRYIRNANDDLFFKPLSNRPLELEPAIPLEVPAGTVVALHGHLPHRSLANRSSRSRCAMTFHVVDCGSTFALDNWIRTPETIHLGDA